MATLSEAYREHPQCLHHIIPLDFSSVRTLPDSHAWRSDSDWEACFGSGSGPSIPVIDLEDPEAKRLIGLACEEWGVFQLKGHGVPLRLLEDVEKEAKRLFGMPASHKLRALRAPGGATGYGRARISPFFPKYMWHEGFTIMGSPLHHAKQIWPHHYQPFW